MIYSGRRVPSHRTSLCWSVWYGPTYGRTCSVLLEQVASTFVWNKLLPRRLYYSAEHDCSTVHRWVSPVVAAPFCSNHFSCSHLLLSHLTFSPLKNPLVGCLSEGETVLLYQYGIEGTVICYRKDRCTIAGEHLSFVLPSSTANTPL